MSYMRSIMRKTTVVVAMVSLVLVPLFTATMPVAAQSAQNEICSGLGQAGGNCNGGSSGSSLNHAITFAINTLSLVAGVAAVIMIIIGGLKYITSNGDANSMSSAKNTIIYSIVGLVIVALAQFIVHFVLGKVG